MRVDNSHIIKARIVEACREPMRAKDLALVVHASYSNTTKYARILESEGWLYIKHERVSNNKQIYHTIRAEPYPNTKPIVEENPRARIIKMDDLAKIPGYFDRPLRKLAYRGVASSMGNME